MSIFYRYKYTLNVISLKKKIIIINKKNNKNKKRKKVNREIENRNEHRFIEYTVYYIV